MLRPKKLSMETSTKRFVLAVLMISGRRQQESCVALRMARQFIVLIGLDHP
jgi:hypothetical protein